MPEKSQPRRLELPPKNGFSIKTIVVHDARVEIFLAYYYIHKK